MFSLIVYSGCTSSEILIHDHVYNHRLVVADVPMITNMIHVVISDLRCFYIWFIVYVALDLVNIISNNDRFWSLATSL